MMKGKQNSFGVEANTICQGPIYLKTPSHQILLCYPGNWIDQNLYNKAQTLKGKITTQSLIDGSLKENFKLLLSSHLKIDLMGQSSVSQKKIIDLFNKMIDEKKSFLNWSVACFEVFCKLDVSTINEIHETDVNLFRKAHLSASTAIWLSLTNNFYEAEFLEDIYQITFLQDSGLVDSAYSYYIAEALDHERDLPGTGLGYLIEQRASQEEIRLFKDHPLKSFENISKLEVLHNQDLAASVLTTHELSNGDGFPFGYSGAVLSSWEKIIILADHLVEYRSTHDFNIMDELQRLESKLESIPVRKVLARSLASITSTTREVSA